MFIEVLRKHDNWTGCSSEISVRRLMVQTWRELLVHTLHINRNINTKALLMTSLDGWELNPGRMINVTLWEWIWNHPQSNEEEQDQRLSTIMNFLVTFHTGAGCVCLFVFCLSCFLKFGKHFFSNLRPLQELWGSFPGLGSLVHVTVGTFAIYRNF